MAEAFARAIGGESGPDDPSLATFADGVAAMEVMDAVRASAPDGRWVTLGGHPEIPVATGPVTSVSSGPGD
jgi:predicted dehydrogenase